MLNRREFSNKMKIERTKKMSQNTKKIKCLFLNVAVKTENLKIN